MLLILRSPKDISEKMRAAGIIMIAVSVTPRPLVDEAELRLIAGSEKRAFTPPNLHVNIYFNSIEKKTLS